MSLDSVPATAIAEPVPSTGLRPPAVAAADVPVSPDAEDAAGDGEDVAVPEAVEDGDEVITAVASTVGDPAAAAADEAVAME